MAYNAELQGLTTCPQPPPSARLAAVPQWMPGEQNGFFPAVNRLGYLTASPTKRFTLYTATGVK